MVAGTAVASRVGVAARPGSGRPALQAAADREYINRKQRYSRGRIFKKGGRKKGGKSTEKLQGQRLFFELILL
jgi:hypothetical protein